MGNFDTFAGVQTMPIALTVRAQAFERLLHNHPVRRVARELGISQTKVSVRKIYTNHHYYDWLQKTCIRQDRTLVRKAVDFWRGNIPISYPAAAKKFCLRPSLIYRTIKQEIDSFPAILKPEVTLLWELQEADMKQDLKDLGFDFDALPYDRPMNADERRRLRKAIQLAEARLLCSESILEIAEESAQGLKK
jgi:hypothetical protein